LGKFQELQNAQESHKINILSYVKKCKIPKNMFLGNVFGKIFIFGDFGLFLGKLTHFWEKTYILKYFILF
jgi:hypothetical protein